MTASETGFERLADLHELERLDLYRADIEGPALVSILRTNPKLKHLSVGKLFVFEILISPFSPISLQTGTRMDPIYVRPLSNPCYIQKF